MRVEFPKIPTDAIIAVEWELHGLDNGTASIEFEVRDGKLIGFSTSRNRVFTHE
jgi:hypothetical protein